MESPTPERRKWEIDRVLEGLVGTEIRVAAESFCPAKPGVERPLRFIPVAQLILPDNSQPAGVPAYFEGRLQQFVREISVVYVTLGPSTSVQAATDGFLYFRGKAAVILRGPAVVKLAFPFRVEQLPSDSANYWRDLRWPNVQFKLPFA